MQNFLRAWLGHWLVNNLAQLPEQLPWSQRLSVILYWQILRRESLLIFFYWHEALRAEKRKPLVATVGNLTFMPSAFDRRF